MYVGSGTTGQPFCLAAWGVQAAPGVETRDEDGGEDETTETSIPCYLLHRDLSG